MTRPVIEMPLSPVIAMFEQGDGRSTPTVHLAAHGTWAGGAAITERELPIVLANRDGVLCAECLTLAARSLNLRPASA
jgi:hypothetical protein